MFAFDAPSVKIDELLESLHNQDLSCAVDDPLVFGSCRHEVKVFDR